MTNADPPYTPPPVENHAPKPPGILPRNAQAWVLGGIALVMVLVIAFSGKNSPKERAAASGSTTSAVIDPNDARIQEYRTRIDEQARKLLAEQAQLAQARQAFGAPPAASGVMSAAPSNPGIPSSGRSSVGYQPAAPPARDRNWIETDKATRNYQSLFASNLALSYRAETATSKKDTSSVRAPEVPSQGTATSGYPGLLAPPVAPTPIAWPPAPWVQPSGETRKEVGGTSSISADVEEGLGGRIDPASAQKARERDRDLDRSAGKTYRLFEGTVIEAVLTNRLDGSFSGPVNGLVTTQVYSHDRHKLLIPQGSRVLGEVRRVETLGQQRLAVSFHRLIMPDGYSVSLDKPQGLNQVGETGLVDQINHHYLQVFGVSLAIGAIAGLSQAGTRYGADAAAADTYRQGMATSLSQSSLHILDRYLNVLPTFTIREGHRMKVYLTDDLLVPAYDAHRMPADL